jgi:hypothetical protein
MVAVCVAAAAAQAQVSVPPPAAPYTASPPAVGAPSPAAVPPVATDPAAGTQMQIKGQAVRVRSGPGTHFYELAMLNAPTKVDTFDVRYGWTAIRPPKSVVALVKKADLAIGEGNKAVVNSPKARVYVEDSATRQLCWAVVTILSRDEPVKILKTRPDGVYCEVEMPKSARVYVDSTLVEPVATTAPSTDTVPVLPPGELPKIKPLDTDPEEKSLDAALAMIDAEMQRPLMDRDFSKAEAALKDVVAKARLVSLLAEVETAQAEIKFQQQLQDGMKKREADRKALEAELEVLRQKEEALIAKNRQAPVIADNKPLYTGTLKKMLARMAYTYRVEDADGNYLCMIEGDDPELGQFVGKKVNLWGTAKYRVDLKINVVTVTSIEQAK